MAKTMHFHAGIDPYVQHFMNGLLFGADHRHVTRHLQMGPER